MTLILLYCIWCCAVWWPKKVSPYISIVQVIFHSFRIIAPILVILKIQYRLSRRYGGGGGGGKRREGCVCVCRGGGGRGGGGFAYAAS